MRRIIFSLMLLLSTPLLAATSSDYGRPRTDYGRVGLYGTALTGPTVRPAQPGRPTVPVTTTTTTNTYIPEVNETETNSTTYEIELDGLKNSCLMTRGNVWANKIYAAPNGTPATSALDEAPKPGDNTCFSVVSVQSKDIKDMGRFFPPRYFQSGITIECGSWLDAKSLEDAILDAKKNKDGRVAGTIVASVLGAAGGVAIMEGIGSTGAFDKVGYRGQQKMDEHMMVMNAGGSDCEAYKANVRILAEKCVNNNPAPECNAALNGKARTWAGIYKDIKDIDCNKTK